MNFSDPSSLNPNNHGSPIPQKPGFARSTPPHLRQGPAVSPGYSNTLDNNNTPYSYRNPAAMINAVGPLTNSIRAQSVENFSPLAIPRLTTTPKRSLTVRALFDYDPNADTGLPGRGLSFHHGDILQVVNATDHQWWQARRMILYTNRPNEGTADPSVSKTTASSITSASSSLTTRTPLGIIPSPERIERRQRARSKRVNFFTKVTVIGPNAAPVPAPGTELPPPHPSSLGSDPNPDSGPVSNSGTLPSRLQNGRDLGPDGTSYGANDPAGRVARSTSLTRNFFKRFSNRYRRKGDGLPLMRRHASIDTAAEVVLDAVRTYETVIPINIHITRPLLVFGPLKERVVDLLLQDPRFSTCVPHTSRPPRSGERDGVDYHFVADKDKMEEDLRSDRFIGVGQFQDHFYATHIDSVRHTLQTGHVCVLDVGLSAVRRLELAGLYPIAILLKPQSVAALRALQRRLTEDQARRSIDLATRMEAENWRLFSTIMTYDSIETVVNEIKQFFQLHAGPLIWIPVDTAARTASDNRSPPGSQSSTLPRGIIPSMSVGN